MSTVNEDLFDAAVALRLEILRLEAGLVEDVLARFEAAIAPTMEVLREIERQIRDDPEAVTPIDIAQIGPLQRQLTEQIRQAKGEIDLLMEQARSEVAETVLLATGDSLRTALPQVVPVREVGAARVVARIDAVFAATEAIGGRLWNEALAADLLAVHDELQAVLTAGAAQGLSVPNLARQIRGATMLEETYKGRFTAIARTEIQRVSNTAAEAVYRDNLDVIKGVQCLATLDSRTCPICAPLHNQVFLYRPDGTLDPNAPKYPLHPRCRCFLSPVTKSWADLGLFGGTADKAERRRMDGTQAESTTFDAWLRKRGRDTQDAILGPTRADLFRGGVALDKFTDGRRVLKLGELRESLGIQV